MSDNEPQSNSSIGNPQHVTRSQNPLSLSSGSIPIAADNSATEDNANDKSAPLTTDSFYPIESPKAKKKGIKNFFAKTVPTIFTFGFGKKNNTNNPNGEKNEKSSEEPAANTNNNNNNTSVNTMQTNITTICNTIKQNSAIEMKIWGVSLDLAARRSDPRGLVPLPISKAIAFVEAHGLEVEGLYRIPAKKSRIEEIRDIFDKGKGDFIVFSEHGIREATGTLVNYINTLPEPLYTTALATSLHAAVASGDLKQIRELIKHMPAPNKETLKVFCVHLAKVAKSSERNKMTLENLATSFGPDYSKILPILTKNLDTVFAETVVFGVSLDKVLQRSIYEVPEVLITCFLFIETYPLDKRYIYYQSGDLNRIRQLKMQFNCGEIVALEPNDLHNASGIVKAFFADLTESIFTATLEPQFIKVKDLPELEQIARLQYLVSKLPMTHIKTLKMLSQHFYILAQEIDLTSMSVQLLCDSIGYPYNKALPACIIHYQTIFESNETYRIEHWDLTTIKKKSHVPLNRSQ